MNEKINKLQEDINDFFEVASKIAISLLPFVVLTNFLTNIEYYNLYFWLWGSLIVILGVISVLYSLNLSINLENLIFKIIAIFLTGFMLVAYIGIGMSIAFDNICKKSFINGKIEMQTRCLKIQEKGKK